MTVRERLALALLIALAISSAGAAQTLAQLVRSYRESPTAARRQAVLRFAASHPKDQNGALALLAAGITEVEQGQHGAAVTHLTAALPRLSELADYTAYYLAKAHLKGKEPAAALKRTEAVLSAKLPSPLAGDAAILAAQAHLTLKSPGAAIGVLKQYYPRLPQPAGDLTLATAYEAAGQLSLAASSAQMVYFRYPVSGEAIDAAQLMARLRTSLGVEYPPPLPSAMLERAGKWFEAGDYRRAQSEFEALVPQLAGAEREQAQVKAGAAILLGGNARRASTYLAALSLAAPEMDAERIYYQVRAARSLDDLQGMLDFVARIERLYPGSDWRLRALTWAGNHYVLRNEPASYVPLFRACFEAFPGNPSAGYCHWKVAWNAYLERRAEAASLLVDHLKLFPESSKCPAALYYLGRLADGAQNDSEARRYYQRLIETYPNDYYVALALERLNLSRPPQRPVETVSFVPNSANRVRISRSRLLASAGLDDLAQRELRFAAGEDGQPHVLAAELARQASGRGNPDEAIRQIKSLFPTYLRTPLEAAPPEVWRLAFPLAYRPQIERHGKARSLDVYLLAGLIRQESEFDASARSRAGARGLMQILPSTGRQLNRTLRLGTFRTTLLDTPDFNIRLGTYYFRSLLDGQGGHLEAALASYNGGKSRVDDWLNWASYREPSEFVETIPITETRTYVQAVLRNAWMYQRIYMGKTSGSVSGAATGN